MYIYENVLFAWYPFLPTRLPPVPVFWRLDFGIANSKDNRLNLDNLVKSRRTVTPAKAGVHNLLESLDSRFRGNDKKGGKTDFLRVHQSKLPTI
jgi:hypothetical protein